MKLIKLSGRLKAIADLVEKGASLADIGTDHGYLPVYLAQNNITKKIIATDISEASLESARRSVNKYKTAKAITLVVTPGLKGITIDDVDTIVIAGMGGETILGILKNAPWTKHKNVTLILQPQSKADLLCRFLYDNEYNIKTTKLIFDKRKQYMLILSSGT